MVPEGSEDPRQSGARVRHQGYQISLPRVRDRSALHGTRSESILSRVVSGRPEPDPVPSREPCGSRLKPEEAGLQVVGAQGRAQRGFDPMLEGGLSFSLSLNMVTNSH